MDKKKAVIWGAGSTGARVLDLVQNDMNVLYFVDSSMQRWGEKYKGYEIKAPSALKEDEEYEVILLATLTGAAAVREKLKEMELPLYQLDQTYVDISIRARILFLDRFSEIVNQAEMKGSVAEAGVYQGEFAKEINRCFPDRKCYLFDTFEGFDERDFSAEQEASLTEAEYLSNTSEQIVLSKMSVPENVVIRKGYFPKTTEGIEDRFVFVNLDMDLYQPTLAGLHYFYPRMESGGVILIHDYFSEGYPNVKKAVRDYEKETGICMKKAAIGDDISLAIIK